MGDHCLIPLLKANKDDFCFISSGTIFQFFGPKYEMVSCPFLYLQMVDETDSHFLTFEKEKNSDTIVDAILFTTLYIIIASASIFFWCIVTELSL